MAPAVDVRRLLAGPAVPLDERMLPDATRLAALLDEAGLTGRGGAGFSTSDKLGALLHHPPQHVVVVGNAMEGEPLSRKDECLLDQAPDLVLDGLAIMAHAFQSPRTVLAVGAQIPLESMRQKATARGGHVEIKSLPDGFVAGQESALVNAINGRRPVPHDRGVPVWRVGVDRSPTLVLNAETLAHVALIVRRGPRWWRAAGTPDDPGTFLVTLSGSRAATVPAPGVVEVERGTLLSTVLDQAGVDEANVAAVLVGGYHGAWVPHGALSTPLTRGALAPYDAAPGAGVLHVLDRHDCPLRTVAGIVTYLAAQSVGQCGPCVNGLPALAEAINTLAGAGTRTGAGRASPGYAHRIDELCDLVERRGACAHPDGTARLVRSTLRVFADHVDSHLEKGCGR